MKVVIFYNITVFVAWIIYSYTQIDLNLTLSSNQTYQYFQNLLIQLGYFNRPLSASIYLILLFLSFAAYVLLVRAAYKKKITPRQIFRLIIGTTLISIFSYPAFSHDIFNYMFDARIVTLYGLNPYFYTALDFPGDLWTRFMHWTHRTYPYGPLWLIITIPLSFLGLQKFLLTLILFKIFFAIFHIGNIYLIYKIILRINPKYAYTGAVFYAFNPLVVIESLISPHNEVMMLFFFLTALYFFKKKFWLSQLMLLISSGIKFVTASLFPVFLFDYFLSRRINERLFLWICFFMLAIVTVVETFYREPYPWYFVLLMGMGAILTYSKNLTILLIGLTMGLLLRYAPYIYLGEYSTQASLWQSWLFILPISFSWVLACYNAYKIRPWR